MVEVKSKPIEQVIGKTYFDRIETIQLAVEDILKNNLTLRNLKYRHIVKLLVEDKLGKQVSDESVPRSCRHIQNTLGLYLPKVEDNRIELEQEYHEYYTQKEE